MRANMDAYEDLSATRTIRRHKRTSNYGDAERGGVGRSNDVRGGGGGGGGGYGSRRGNDRELGRKTSSSSSRFKQATTGVKKKWRWKK